MKSSDIQAVESSQNEVTRELIAQDEAMRNNWCSLVVKVLIAGHCVVGFSRKFMAEDEKTFLCGYRKIPRYGTTAGVPHSSPRTIKYKVEPTDTLAGIALKFGTSMTEIKRVNRLWSQESMYLHEYLDIPVSDYEHYLEDTEICATTAAERKSSFCSTSFEDKTAIPLQCIKSKKPKRRSTEGTSTVAYPSAGEFFEKIDSCIRQITNNVKHMEENFETLS
ncbi:unnamed protein product [Soboliphyme baturini]|uniref:LysM domain-containing protein n=1 Tax=Soboliphyme baturini TaxID=241478 RepID=A0A183IDB9_9BILA|nr:unnamed protein product [Soboliphyme baturini]